jgi:hypothetical protein
LNRDRLEMLNRQFPGILNRKDIRWEILEQRNAITRENAVRCFHGFVLVMARAAPPSSESKTEISSVERILRTVRDTSYDIPLSIDYRIKKVRVPTGKYLPRSDKKKRNGFRYDKPGIWFREPETKVVRDSIEKNRSGGYTVHKRIFDASLLPDTNVLEILNRQRDLKKKVVVQDVTGSMAPYTTQVLLWILLQPELLNEGKFLFFNDGDNMPDEWKVIGKTGGLYPLRTSHADTLKDMAFRAMRNGSGGDIPENNVEAILRAIEAFPEADTLLMIADNMAPVKDMKLLGRVSKPVNIVLCNIGNNINPNMIDIVIKTGGFLLFENGQVFDPRKARDGTKLLIGRKTFEYRRNRFTLLHVARPNTGMF